LKSALGKLAHQIQHPVVFFNIAQEVLVIGSIDCMFDIL